MQGDIEPQRLVPPSRGRPFCRRFRGLPRATLRTRRFSDGRSVRLPESIFLVAEGYDRGAVATTSKRRYIRSRAINPEPVEPPDAV